MAKRRHDERKVISSLSRKGISFNYANHEALVNKESSDVVGIHSLGKLDYLEHYCGWIVKFVSKSVAISNFNEIQKHARDAKKEKKLNMVSMVKKQIKKVK